MDLFVWGVRFKRSPSGPRGRLSGPKGTQIILMGYAAQGLKPLPISKDFSPLKKMANQFDWFFEIF